MLSFRYGALICQFVKCKNQNLFCPSATCDQHFVWIIWEHTTCTLRSNVAVEGWICHQHIMICYDLCASGYIKLFLIDVIRKNFRLACNRTWVLNETNEAGGFVINFWWRVHWYRFNFSFIFLLVDFAMTTFLRRGSQIKSW